MTNYTYNEWQAYLTLIIRKDIAQFNNYCDANKVDRLKVLETIKLDELCQS